MTTERIFIVLAGLTCIGVIAACLVAAAKFVVSNTPERAIPCCAGALVFWWIGCAIAESLLKGRR